jgi:hypothetical protein
MWLSDWRLTPLFVSTVSSQAPQSASNRRVPVQHSSKGGLTDREVTVRLHSRHKLSWVEPLVTPVLPKSVYLVASDTVDQGVMVAKTH